MKSSYGDRSDSILPTDEGVKSPHKHDVLYGRGPGIYNHRGNVTFRLIVNRNKSSYDSAAVLEKKSVARVVVDAVRQQNPPGRFLEKNKIDGLWYEVSDETAVVKAQKILMAKRRAARAGAMDPNKGGKTNENQDFAAIFEPFATHLKDSADTEDIFGAGTKENFLKRKRITASLQKYEVSHTGSTYNSTTDRESPKKMQPRQPVTNRTNNVLDQNYPKSIVGMTRGDQKYFESIVEMTPSRSTSPISTLQIPQQNAAAACLQTQTGAKDGPIVLEDSSVDANGNKETNRKDNNSHLCPKNMCDTNSDSIGTIPVSFSPLGSLKSKVPKPSEVFDGTEAASTEGSVGYSTKLNSSFSTASILNTASLLTIPSSQISTLENVSFSMSPSLCSHHISFSDFELSNESIALLTCTTTQVLSEQCSEKGIVKPMLQSNKKIKLLTSQRPRSLGAENRIPSLLKDFEDSPFEARLRAVPKTLPGCQDTYPYTQGPYSGRSTGILQGLKEAMGHFASVEQMDMAAN